MHWKPTLITVLLGLLFVWGVQAGTEVASDEELAALRANIHVPAVKPTPRVVVPKVPRQVGNVQIAVTRPEKSYVFPEPNILQAIACSFTKTAVLLETRAQRRAQKDKKTVDIVVRRRRLTLRYTRDAYGEKCFLAAGRLKWETIDGQWTGTKVSLRTLNSVLNILRANRIGVSRISVSVTNKDDLRKTKIILDELRLRQRSLIGINPYVGNRATVIFGRTK